ncbi:O-antigen polymerase [Arenibacter certesii]|uniref:Oligosaccharide repeat unit polymerase n=1 Tax=Arenibacter certesii TaxID=228955 RepID=A0A918ILZ0_9FLAO|nr:O-antigen polymerase [Arenibacter certesii]GGW22058.1 hypothetical protein GCM10007383_01360 [Arenibacter certesii]
MKSIIYLLVLITLILLTPYRLETFNAAYNFNISVVYLVTLLYFFYQQSRYNKNWLRFDVIFLIGYTIVHFQIPFLASIGIEPERPSFIWINKDVVNFATWMSAVTIVLWMWGFSLYGYRKRTKQRAFNSQNSIINYCKYDIILFLSFIVFLSLVGTSIFQGVYDGGGSWGNGANHAFLLLRVLLYLRIIYFFRSFKRNTSLKRIVKKLLIYKLFLITLSIYTLLFLLSGDRGPVLYVSLVAGGAYALYIRPVPLRKLILIVFLGAFLFTVIRLGRGRDSTEFNESNIFERGYANYTESEQGVNVTDELASSVRIQYRALDVIPNKHPYLYGITFFTVGIGTAPFLGSTIMEVFDIPKQYAGSAMFFTVLGQGPNPSYGEGSEILADIYINFGLYGTFIIMFIFGIYTNIVNQRAQNFDFTYVLIFLILLTSAITMNRAMLLSPLKDIVYVLFFNWIFTRVIK